MRLPSNPMNEPMVNVTGLDHIVLMVADVEASLAFYCDKLGLEGERLEQWRAGEVFFPSVRINEHIIIDLFAGERWGTNLDHFALAVTPDTDLRAIAESEDFEVITSPVPRWGARGDGLSLYLRDPDGNTVELKQYEA